MLFIKKIKLELTKEQQHILDSQSKIANWLYNHYLAMFTSYYNMFEKVLTYSKVKKNFLKLKKKHPFLKSVDESVLRNTLKTLEMSFQDYLSRIAHGDRNAGFPKFKSWKSKWRILEYDKGRGFCFIENNKTVKISFGKTLDKKTGKKYTPSIIVHLSEELKNKASQITIIKEKNQYFICFRIEQEELVVQKSDRLDVIRYIQLGLMKMFSNENNQQERQTSLVNKKSDAWNIDKQINKIKEKQNNCKKNSNRFNYLNNAISRLYNKRREQIKHSMYTTANKIIKDAKKIIFEVDSPFKSGIKDINQNETQGLAKNFKSILENLCKKNQIEIEIVSKSNNSDCVNNNEKEKNTNNEPKLKNQICIFFEGGSVLQCDVNYVINILRETLRRTRHSLGFVVDCLNECIANLKSNPYETEISFSS